MLLLACVSKSESVKAGFESLLDLTKLCSEGLTQAKRHTHTVLPVPFPLA